MTYRIRVQPSGHEFTCEARETLLEAALRAGLNLNHGCLSGTCGDCLARVVQGPVGSVEFHDYVIGEALRGQGCTLLCRTRPGGDMVIEAHEAAGSQDIPEQQVTARVARVEAVGEAYRVLHLRTPRTRTLRFLAGQSVSLTLAGLPARTLAVASCPCNGLVLQFHLRREPGDPFSERVFGSLAAGDPVELQGPYGSFTLDENERRPLLMVAADTGFAPLKSLIEHAIALEWAAPLQLVRIAPEAGEHYLGNYCHAWEDALDAFTYRPLALGAGAYGDLAPQVVAGLQGVAGADVYLAGPEEMVRAFGESFRAAGVPPARLHAEPFLSPPVAVAAVRK